MKLLNATVNHHEGYIEIKAMKVTRTRLPDVLLIDPDIHKDERGFLLENFNSERYEASGIPETFVQDNHSGSRKGTLRGLHYQVKQPQGKLVIVVVGEVYDVAVDLRKSSPSFGRWTGHNLSSDNHRQMWIPEGLAHGFLVISEWAEVIYKLTDYYDPDLGRTLLWNDPALGIEWPLAEGENPMLSHKDAHATPLRDADVFS
jgi:dTDP-4-dehydrorhamnose 3,5-epimerase